MVYPLDRATGEFLWATSTIAQNVISHINGATGQQVTVCPTQYCGKDWESVYRSAKTPMDPVFIG